MLPEVARQTGDLLAELQIEADAAVADGESRLARAVLEGIVVGGELELREQLREAVQLLLRQSEDLADLARGGASPVRDHIGGHRRTRRAVALVDVLDHLFALVAAREIEIDVRPRLVPGRVGALFGEEALEEQVHLHRIDGGDPERVADRAVGRRAAPLHEHVLAPAEQDDVVDDEEVPGEAEPGDERQLPLELRARPGPARAARAAVAPAGAVHGPVPQLTVQRLRVQELRLGELVAEIVERVGAALGDLARQPHRFRQIAELRGDLARGAYVPLGIAREAPARFIQRGLEADASERVEQRLPAWRGMADARAGDDAHAARSRRVDPAAVLALLPRVEMPAHFREQPLGPRCAARTTSCCGVPALSATRPWRKSASCAGVTLHASLPPFACPSVSRRQRFLYPPRFSQSSATRPPPSTSISAPTSGRTPWRRAMAWKRGMP